MARLRRPFSLVTRAVPRLAIRPENTVLLVQDLQRFLADRDCGIGATARHRGIFSEFEEYFRAVDAATENIVRLKEALTAFGIPTWYTRWAVSRTTGMSPVQRALAIVPAEDDAAAEIVEAAAPGPGDAVFPKAGLGALSSPDLAAALAQWRIENLILCGLTTEYGITPTAFQAMDSGRRPLVVADGCAAMTQLAHETALDGLSFGMVKIRPMEELLYGLEPLARDDVVVL